jgi:hypothetical protein
MIHPLVCGAGLRLGLLVITDSEPGKAKDYSFFRLKPCSVALRLAYRGHVKGISNPFSSKIDQTRIIA